MMRPLALVVVIVGVLLAGCTGGGTAPGTAIDPPPTETATETTPERDPCIELDSRTLPEFPTTLTNESVVEFTERYVNASAWNEVHAGDRLRHASVSTEVLLLNRTDAGYVVHVTVFAHVTTCEGAQGVNTFGWDYFVNESLIARNKTHPRGIQGSIDSPRDHAPISGSEILQNGTILTRTNTSSN